MPKRNDYINWDEYFMGIAMLSAMRSKDPSTQVGACIVSPDKKIVGVGYNGFPRGCSDEEFPWERAEDNWNDNKYPYVCHAELNAILNSMIPSLRESTLYVTLFPCNECAKAIIQTGIRKVVYLSDKYKGSPETNASRKMFEAAGVSCIMLETNRDILELRFEDKGVDR